MARNELSQALSRIEFMTKRQQQTAFLKTLILHGKMEDQGQLQERIQKAERDELCAWRALGLVSLLAIFSCCGICYSAVLIPEFFQNSSSLIVKFFFGLALASLICAVAFLFVWLWCRGVSNRVQLDCRRFVMAILEPGLREAHTKFFRSSREEQKSRERQTVEKEGSDASVAPAYQTYSQLFSLRRSS